MADRETSEIWNEGGPTQGDIELAEEIARFVADRAFRFDDHECSAWALTDFRVWANLAGHEPELGFQRVPRDHSTDSEQ